MVQIGKNLNVKTTQLTKNVKVSTTKSTGTKNTEASKSAVWVDCNGKTNVAAQDLKAGDVLIVIRGDKVQYYRLTLDAQGDRELLTISAGDVQDRDYEKDRGDIRS